MRVYTQNKNYTLYNGSMLDMPEVIAENSIDAVVTDPPYELNFMGKGWDNSGIAFRADTWRKCFEVLKPGGYLLAFGGTRTYHRIASAIEDAGFEIRDCIMWLYGSGFPKSMSLGKAIESKLVNGNANKQAFKTLQGDKVKAGDWGINANCEEQGFRPANYDSDGHLRVTNVDYQTAEGKKWDGWGTALKPAYEPIIVARRPCEGSTTDNVLTYGVGGINIDECRVATDELKPYTPRLHKGLYNDDGWEGENTLKDAPNGRFPANVILTHDDTECGEGSAARYFYCAKASKRDRDEGMDAFEEKALAFSNQAQAEAKRGSDEGKGGMNYIRRRKNTHPTVKPTDLMQYLIRLVTPKGGTILDPL